MPTNLHIRHWPKASADDINVRQSMKRLLQLVGVLLASFAYLVVLSFFAPRDVFVLMLVPSLVAIGCAFTKKKALVITVTCVVLASAAFAVTPIDVHIVSGEKKKGLFFLPIDYGIGSRSVDQGYCPGGCIVEKRSPTHAIVLSI